MTRNTLSATTALSTGILPAIAVSAGLLTSLGGNASAEELIKLPLVHFDQNQRVGLNVGINGAAPRLYMFDTGSDQFNAAIDPAANARPIQGQGLRMYAYGNSTYGYVVQPVAIEKLSYYGTQGRVFEHSSDYQIASIIDYVYTQNTTVSHGDLSKDPALDSQGRPFMLGDDNYYADLTARAKMKNGFPAETDGSHGTIGGGDFLASSSLNSSPIGGLTKTGYIVSANANIPGSGTVPNTSTPGCAPCVIVGLNPALRAQYNSTMSWKINGEVPHGKDYRPSFPNQANASTEYEGNYDLKLGAAEGQGPNLGKVAALLDTGTPGGGSVDLSKETFDKLQAAHVEFKITKDTDGSILSASGTIPNITIAAPGGELIELTNIVASYTKDTDPNNPKATTFVAGLDLFQRYSVMYDLEKQTTAYSPYFVTADNFTTDTPSAGQAGLSRITMQTGSQGRLGVAGVISGSGALTLDPQTNVRLTNVNTYTGATNIGQDAFLSLAGFGSIEQSAKVVADGTLDISQHGNDDYWGISGLENMARIRSLSGGSLGSVQLGNQTLVLTAANDVFAGSINDLDVDNKPMGGGLLIAGGVQTLSGKNSYAGLTTVNSGAGLLLTDTASIVRDVTTAGFLGNDGQVGGTALANGGGVVAGTGRYGAVTIGGSGIVAPGSALDPARAVSALTVSGNFLQQSGSVYQAGLAASADLIEVGGKATIDNGAQIEPLRQGTASVDTRYTLLTAAGGVTGTYGLTGTLVADSPFVDFALAYDANTVYLDTSRTNTAFADVAETFNQRSTATAAAALGTGNPISANILFLTTQEARNAFDQLSGEVHASVQSALTEDSHFARDAASDRIRSAFGGVNASAVAVTAYGPGGPELAPATSERFAVWGSAFGAWGHLDGDGNAARFKRSNGGFIAGGDAAVAENWRLGLLAGYSHTSFDADERSASGSSDNYHLGIYAGTQHGNLGFRSGLAYSWHRIETQRSVAFPGFTDSLSSDYDARTFQAFGELGYRMDTASASFEPYANLAYVNLDADGFTEKGGAAALSSEGRSSDTTFTTIGLRASTGLSLGSVQATARGGLGWRHAFGERTPGIDVAFTGGSLFAVEGTPIARDAALIEAGLDMNLTEQATFGVAYQGQLASTAQEHGFNARLAVRF